VEIKAVNPSMKGSHEHNCHLSGKGNFLLPLRDARMRDNAREVRYERAIGVIYRPDTEFISHYFEADLTEQFDEYIWFEESSAVTPLTRDRAPDLPEKHPFAVID